MEKENKFKKKQLKNKNEDNKRFLIQVFDASEIISNLIEFI